MRFSLLLYCAFVIALSPISENRSLHAQIEWQISGIVEEWTPPSADPYGLVGAELVFQASVDNAGVWQEFFLGGPALSGEQFLSVTVTISGATNPDANVKTDVDLPFYRPTVPGVVEFTNATFGLLDQMFETYYLAGIPGTLKTSIGDPITVQEFAPHTFAVFRFEVFPGFGSYQLSPDSIKVSAVDGQSCILGDISQDGEVDLLDVQPFVDLLSKTGSFQCEADINQDGVVNLLDVDPFVALLSGG